MTVDNFYKISNEIKQQFANDSSGHDWFHIERVYKNTLLIQKKEGGNAEIVSLLAILHDISDHKMNGGILNHGSHVARELMEKLKIDAEIIEKVAPLVDEISFKGAGVSDKNSCLESKIVQDADRLDAIGAIGIARAFAFGGNKNRPMYDPELKPMIHDSFEAYADSKSHTINHFYEKLLLIKDRMHTKTGRKMAQERHDFMVNFLNQFYAEWEVNSPI